MTWRSQPMWIDPHNGGKQECQVCGKFQYPVIHSCSGFPRTPAAWERYEKWRKEEEAD